ncbi:MAG: hypothetical protein HF308_19290 [Ignavibacteria bacterium]|jgi:hypothetical protein|nr:hypothetical protein [Ignavibacteria bacterium]MCU7526626.1 hypothetical protein [Ignavibacteria bacterium]
MELNLEQRQKLLDRIVVDLEVLVDGQSEEDLMKEHWDELKELNELVDVLTEDEGVIVEPSQTYAIGRQAYWDELARRQNEVKGLLKDKEYNEETVDGTVADYYEELRSLDDTLKLLREDLSRAKIARDKYFDALEKYDMSARSEVGKH